MRIRKIAESVPLPSGQVIDSLNGSSTTNAPSIRAVNEGLQDIYSTNEVKTNKIWIDNKPIYRKTFQFSGSAFTTQRQDIAHNIANIDNVINNHCFFYAAGHFRQFPIIYYGNLSNWSGQLFVTKTLLKFELGSTLLGDMQSSNSTTYVTLEYTKTTD